MRALFRTTRFKKDYKKLANADKLILKTTITTIVNNQLLDKKYQDHLLIGDFVGCRECHLRPDLLLIYKISIDYLELIRVGSHAKLFK